VINVSQLITVDKSILTGKVKSLPSSVMRRVEDGIRLVLSLEA
jgi:mRNA interferase MazF